MHACLWGDGDIALGTHLWHKEKSVGPNIKIFIRLKESKTVSKCAKCAKKQF